MTAYSRGGLLTMTTPPALHRCASRSYPPPRRHHEPLHRSSGRGHEGDRRGHARVVPPARAAGGRFAGSGAPGSGQEIVEKATSGDTRGLEKLLKESYGGDDDGDAKLDASTRAIRAAQVRTAAQRAAHVGQAGTLRILLRHGADLGLELGNGRTIAVEAAARGHADVLRLLLTPTRTPAADAADAADDDEDIVGGGASTEVQNGYGRTALMEAAKNGHVDCVLAAVEAGADVNFATKNANVTAAMFAAAEGRADCLNALRRAGADLDVRRNQDGKTAMQIHRERVAAEMMRFKHSVE